MAGMDDGPGHRARGAGLVPRRLGRDDGGDDVPVGGADGRPVRAHDPAPLAGRAAACSPPATSSRGPRRACSPTALFDLGRSLLGDQLAWDGAGRWVAGGTLSSPPSTSSRRSRTSASRSAAARSASCSARGATASAGALSMGARHGAWCVGCCWALMASLFALGVMSLAWMAFVAALIALEKTLPWGRVVDLRDRALLLVLGVVLIAAPDAVPGLTVPGSMARTRWGCTSPICSTLDD